MKAFRIALLLALLSSPAFAQRIQTATRLVTIFTNLENQLMAALAGNNGAAAVRLLTEDFSQWTPQPPGSPTPREEWLKNAGRDFGNGQIRQMSAKDLGDHVAVNFVLVTGKKAFFVVDIWQKAGPDWQLATRYLTSVNPAPYRGPARPTGKD